MSNELPKGWVNVAFFDFCVLQRGYDLPLARVKEGLHPVVTSAGIVARHAEFKARGPGVVTGRSGSIGRVFFVECDYWPHNTALFVKDFKGNNPKFVYFFLRGFDTARYSASTAVPTLNRNNLRDVTVKVPPLPEQRRIVAKLEKLLGKVDACQKRLAKIPVLLKRFRQSVLAAACSGRLTGDLREEHRGDSTCTGIVDAIRRRRVAQAHTAAQRKSVQEIYTHKEDNDSESLPVGWGFVALAKICESFDYGTSNKSLPRGKVAVLRMGNIQKGRIDWTDLVYTSNEADINRLSLQPMTVLFNRTNSPELVGKTAIYRGEQPAIFAGYLIRVNHCPELDPEYLNFCLNTNYSRDFCQKVKTDGVSQSNINAQKLGAFEVPFCCLSEQQEIVRRVDALFALADQIEARYNKAKTQVDKLTQSILAKAFRGELVPQDPNDEPASVLLERIAKGKSPTVKAPSCDPRKRRDN